MTGVLPLLPPGPLLDDAALAAHYAYPEPLAAPFVRVNFVTSADGATEVAGRSGGLGSPADRKVFGLLRELADVILVGAGTVRAEDYRGARRGSPPPPIAVVTGSADLDPASRLLTDTAVAPIVLTTAAAPSGRLAALAAAGADVAILERLDAAAILAELARRGHRKVLCEGGPRLFGELIACDAVDELCLTVAPLLVGGPGGRIACSAEAALRPMTLVGAISADDALLLRYQSHPPIG